MSSNLFLALLCAVCWLTGSQTAQALVIMGEIAPGEVKLGYGWANEGQFTALIKQHKAVGGHFLDAPTWWDGHFSADYFYQGNEDQLQLVINALEKLDYNHAKIVVTGSEGFWDGHGLLPRPDSLAYDWSLSFSATTMRDPAKYKYNGQQVINEPVVVLRIYLGDRLDRDRLRLPQELLNYDRISNAVEVVGADSPANALHAIARAMRDSH